MRTALCLDGGEEVELILLGERIEVTPAPRQVKLQRDAHGVLTSDLQISPHGPEEVREALEQARR
jgi:hypothetical protein